MDTKLVPWVDKYRPNKLNYIVHQQELMKTLYKILETGDMPHLLFYGPPGTGKTTTILALASELFGPHKFKERVLELNASDERGINVVRNDIIFFAKTIIGNPDPNYKCPPFKILILDEADAMTPDAQAALRKVMEETSSITRFCRICNYVEKIIDPIISRCMQFRFMPIDTKIMCERLKFIGKKENIELGNDIYDTIVNVVNGDLRKGIMLLQNIKYVIKSKKNINVDDVYNLIGYVPQTMITQFIKKCMQVEDRINKEQEFDIIKITQEFYTSGYSIANLCEQLCHKFIDDENIADDIKIKIVNLLSKISNNLNNGANEFIQLTKLIVNLHYILQ